MWANLGEDALVPDSFDESSVFVQLRDVSDSPGSEKAGHGTSSRPPRQHGRGTRLLAGSRLPACPRDRTACDTSRICEAVCQRFTEAIVTRKVIAGHQLRPHKLGRDAALPAFSTINSGSWLRIADHMMHNPKMSSLRQ
jgi:hypothetical protein